MQLDPASIEAGSARQPTQESGCDFSPLVRPPPPIAGERRVASASLFLSRIRPAPAGSAVDASLLVAGSSAHTVIPLPHALYSCGVMVNPVPASSPTEGARLVCTAPAASVYAVECSRPSDGADIELPPEGSSVPSFRELCCSETVLDSSVLGVGEVTTAFQAPTDHAALCATSPLSPVAP